MEHPLFIHTVPLLNFRCKQQRLLCISHYLILTTFWSPKPKHCGILPSSHFLLLVGCILAAFSIYSSRKATYLLIKTCSLYFLLTSQSLVFSGNHFKYNFSSNYAFVILKVPGCLKWSTCPWSVTHMKNPENIPPNSVGQTEKLERPRLEMQQLSDSTRFSIEKYGFHFKPKWVFR